MSPLEPRKPEQAIKLRPLLGTLVCAALPFICGAIPFLLRRPEGSEGYVSCFMFSVSLLCATFFCVRLLGWCNSRHFFTSLPILFLLLIIYGALGAGKSHDNPFYVPLLTSFIVFVVGGLGMVIGDFGAKRTAAMRHPAAVRTLIVAMLLGLLLDPSVRFRINADLTTRRLQKAGSAPLKANVVTLERTVITPVLDAPLNNRTNVIWCGTTQLAWNELRSLVGEEVQMENQDPMVDALNRGTLATGDLDLDTYVVAAARSNDHALRNLRARVDKAFKGAVTPELIPDPGTLSQNAFVLYAALFVNLPFGNAFNRLERPFLFCDEKVAAFGTEGAHGDPRQQLKVRAQVSLCDYRSPDDFVIALRTKRKEHQLILAKVPASATLADTATSALRRVPPRFEGDPYAYKSLVVPIADYDLTRTYSELLGRPLAVKNPMFHKMPIEAAAQSIRFKLDERGAILKSETLIGAKSASATPKEEKPDLIFDKPFLVLLKCAASDQPYFAMWVANAEVLVPF